MSVHIPDNSIIHHIHPSFHLISVLFYTVFIYRATLQVLAQVAHEKSYLKELTQQNVSTKPNTYIDHN